MRCDVIVFLGSSNSYFYLSQPVSKMIMRDTINIIIMESIQHIRRTCTVVLEIVYKNFVKIRSVVDTILYYEFSRRELYYIAIRSVLLPFIAT